MRGSLSVAAGLAIALLCGLALPTAASADCGAAMAAAPTACPTVAPALMPTARPVTATPSPTVAGFEQNNAARGFVTPIVEPGGSDQPSPSRSVAGVQTGPTSVVRSLPATTTDERTPALPLAAMGLAIMALGGLLLRRRDERR